jgi:hypothetical protein
MFCTAPYLATPLSEAHGRGPEALRPRLATGLLLTIYESGRLQATRFDG